MRNDIIARDAKDTCNDGVSQHLASTALFEKATLISQLVIVTRIIVLYYRDVIMLMATRPVTHVITHTRYAYSVAIDI